MTIASLLMGSVVWVVEDDCKSTCVKSGANPSIESDLNRKIVYPVMGSSVYRFMLFV